MTIKDDVRKFMGAETRKKAPITLREMENYGREKSSDENRKGQDCVQHVDGIQSVDGTNEESHSGRVKGDIPGNNQS